MRTGQDDVPGVLPRQEILLRRRKLLSRRFEQRFDRAGVDGGGILLAEPEIHRLAVAGDCAAALPFAIDLIERVRLYPRVHQE